ncbi:hypothetical protein GT50_00325 [Geobacillus stearothermophilus 10]|nr:hypothetical protein GT50_00325 [Geobacillus stearothermophilus 10]
MIFSPLLAYGGNEVFRGEDMIEDTRMVWQWRVPAVGVASISISVFLLNCLLVGFGGCLLQLKENVSARLSL